MGKSGKQNVIEDFCLTSDCASYMWMRVAVQVYPPGRDGVNDPAAIFRV